MIVEGDDDGDIPGRCLQQVLGTCQLIEQLAHCRLELRLSGPFHAQGVVKQQDCERRLAKRGLVEVERLRDDRGVRDLDRGEHPLRVDAPVRIEDAQVDAGWVRVDADAGASTETEQFLLDIVREQVCLQILEDAALVRIALVDVTEGRVGDRSAVPQIEDVERFPVAGDEGLVGLDDGRFVVDHGVIRVVLAEEEVLQERRVSGCAADGAENALDLVANTWLM